MEENSVKLHFSIVFSNKEIVQLLEYQHHIIICIRTLQRICERLEIFQRKDHATWIKLYLFVNSRFYSHKFTTLFWKSLKEVRRTSMSKCSKT